MARLAIFFSGSGLVRPLWRRFSMPAGTPPLLSAFSIREITKTQTNTPKNPHRPDSAKTAKPARAPPPIYKNRRRCAVVPFFGCRRPQPKMRTNTKKRTSFLLIFSGGSCFAVFSEAEKKRTKGQDYSRIRRFKVCGCSFSKSNDLSTLSLVCRRKKRTKGQDYSPNSSDASPSIDFDLSIHF